MHQFLGDSDRHGEMAGASNWKAKGGGLFSRALTEVRFSQIIHRGELQVNSVRSEGVIVRIPDFDTAGSSLDSEQSKVTNRVVITLIPGINAGALQILQMAWWV